MKGHYTVAKLVHRFTCWKKCFPPLFLIHCIISYPMDDYTESYLPQNMKQRMADLLQLELVKLNLL